MSEPCRWRRGERYGTCVDDGVRGSAPKRCTAYSRARCLPSSEATAHPSFPPEVESSLAPCFLLSPAKPLRWVSLGARSGYGFPINRVDGDDICGSGIIDTIDPTEADKPLAITFSEGH